MTHIISYHTIPHTHIYKDTHYTTHILHYTHTQDTYHIAHHIHTPHNHTFVHPKLYTYDTSHTQTHTTTHNIYIPDTYT